MNKNELYQQAMGLKRSAEKALNTGKGEETAESIVRKAAQNLIWNAIRCDTSGSGLESLKTSSDTKWSEIYEIASAVSEFASGAPKP